MLKRLYHKILDLLHMDGSDFGLFVMSLLLAIGFWLIYKLSLQTSQEVSVPVVAAAHIEGYAEQSANTVNVSALCRLTGYKIMRIRFETRVKPRTVEFAASDLKLNGEDEFVISFNELGVYMSKIFGDDVQLESFTMAAPPKFRFYQQNCKKVPVVPVCTLDFKPQHMATGTMKTVPDSVVVYGDPKYLDNLDRVNTERISLSRLTSDVHGTAKLELPRNVRVDVKEVRYEQGVSRYVDILKEVKIGVRNAPSGHDLMIFPPTANVVFRCVFPISKNPTDNVRFYIDYKDFVNSLSGTCIPKTTPLPAGVIDYVIEPQVFECVESFRK